MGVPATGAQALLQLTVTALSVLVALSIGVIVLLQLLAEEFRVPALGWVARIDLQYVGFALVAVFVLVWAGSVGAFQLLERRRGIAGR